MHFHLKPAIPPFRSGWISWVEVENEDIGFPLTLFCFSATTPLRLQLNPCNDLEMKDFSSIETCFLRPSLKRAYNLLGKSQIIRIQCILALQERGIVWRDQAAWLQQHSCRRYSELHTF